MCKGAGGGAGREGGARSRSAALGQRNTGRRAAGWLLPSTLQQVLLLLGLATARPVNTGQGGMRGERGGCSSGGTGGTAHPCHRCR